VYKYPVSLHPVCSLICWIFFVLQQQQPTFIHSQTQRDGCSDIPAIIPGAANNNNFNNNPHMNNMMDFEDADSQLVAQLENDGAAIAQEDDVIDLEKNSKYINGLIDNLSSALDKYILRGSNQSKEQSQNIMTMIESQAKDQELILRANRMVRRAGLPAIQQQQQQKASS
jgi:hypothetical protein